MTIPIKPGPFSFLAGLGQAGGAAVAAAEQQRQKGFEEAHRSATLLLQLAKEDPSILRSPHAKAIYERMGIMGPETPSPDENIRNIKNRYLAPIESPEFTLPLSGLITGASDVDVKSTGRFVPAYQQVAAGYSPLGVGREEQAGLTLESEAAKSKAGIATSQLEGETARALLPGAAMTALAGQHQQQGKEFSDNAYRIVIDEYLKSNDGQGGYTIPTPAQALAAAKLDPQTRAYGKFLSEPYFAEAIRSLQENIRKLDIAELGARNRGPGTDDYLKLLLQGAGIRSGLTTKLPEPSPTDRGIAMAWNGILGKAGNDPKKIAALMNNPVYKQYRDAAKKVEDYEAYIQQETGAIRSTVTDVSTEAASRAGAGGRVRSPAGQSLRKIPDENVDALIRDLLKGSQPDEDIKSAIDEDIRSGEITAADGAAIKARLDEIDLVTGTKRKYKGPRLTKPLEVKRQPTDSPVKRKS